MLQMDLTLFDPNASQTSKIVPCDDNFCTSTYEGEIDGCNKEMACPYSITYGDGSTTTGTYVKDLLTFNKLSGNNQTAPETSSVVFG